jgi:adenine-specific DNA-methyltransferase
MYPNSRLDKSLELDAELIRRIWEVLNRLEPEQLLGEGRVYGGGLHKLEPRELANVDATAIAELIPDFKPFPSVTQLGLF